MLTLLYGIFEKDFKRTRPELLGSPVWWDRRLDEEYGYEEGFWHLISRDDKVAGERIPDFRRAERLSWCQPTIVHTKDKAIKVWNYEEGKGRARTYLWLEGWDYCIVLQKRRNAMILITAFHLDGDSKKRNLSKKYANREQ